MRNPLILTTVAALLLGSTTLSAETITTGTGEGTVSIDVGLFGQFQFASFDPIGPVNRADTTFNSYVALTQGNTLTPLGGFSDVFGEDEIFVDGPTGDLTPDDTGATLISQSETSITSSFDINRLSFQLTQTVTDAVNADGAFSGAILTQSYDITNVEDAPNRFSLLRYFDGDLAFDGSIDDGGGVIVQNGQTVLFETDATGNETDADTFVGITAEGGTPSAGRYDVTFCCGFQNFPLTNSVSDDTNGDGFIDFPYDVTLSMSNDFLIPAGATVNYTTQTLFGNSEPPAPGSTETLPLLPTVTNNPGTTQVSFQFDIPIIDFENLPEDFVSERIFIDPIVASGYTYEIVGADFAAVTAPSLAAVPDSDAMYTLIFGTTSVSLAAGATFDFMANGGGVNSFRIEAIDLGLELDPNDPTAFVTGISFTNPTTNMLTITQTPILTDTDATGPAPVPLPASVLFLGLGLAGLGGVARRRKAA